jgi:hypothetical protein
MYIIVVLGEGLYKENSYVAGVRVRGYRKCSRLATGCCWAYISSRVATAPICMAGGGGGAVLLGASPQFLLACASRRFF